MYIFSFSIALVSLFFFGFLFSSAFNSAHEGWKQEALIKADLAEKAAARLNASGEEAEDSTNSTDESPYRSSYL